MTTPATAETVRRLLADVFADNSVLEVTLDDYDGVRVSVVSESFEDLPVGARNELVRSAVQDTATLAHIAAFTPSEYEDALLDVEAGVSTALLPLWPESLVRGQQFSKKSPIVLPSRADEPLDPPFVVTFYSLRGGVGRSTALAHTAAKLSERNRVLCIDMDLEAPGLASLFDVEQQVDASAGVVPWLLQSEIAGEAVPLDGHLIVVGESSRLLLLPAGVPDANYARRLSLLDPSAWYHEDQNPLRLLIDAAKSLAFAPEIILIDSRTGISPLAAPLLFDLADMAVLTFFPHPQGLAGTRALTRALLSSRTRRQSADGGPFAPEPRFLVSPVPVAGSAEIRKRYEDRSTAWISDWLSDAMNEDGGPAFPDVEEVVHVVGYSDDIAASDSIYGVRNTSAFDVVADWVAGFLSDETVPSVVAGEDPNLTATQQKAAILGDLRFSTGTAEAQSDEDFEESFLQTDIVDRAMQSSVPLVLGRKGTGKTALFRRLAAQENCSVVTSPPGLNVQMKWVPDSETYKSIARFLQAQDIEWRVFWPVLVGIRLCLNSSELPRPEWSLPREPHFFTADQFTYTAVNFVDDVRLLLEDADAPLRAQAWLDRIDGAMPRPQMLLFDGLDTGFGLSESDLNRRRSAISGLLGYVMAKSDTYRNLQFKVMLREDIWREVPVPNKSHFYGREVRLAWSDQVDYLRVVVKQAYRSDAFRNAVKARSQAVTKLADVDVQYWPASSIYEAWTTLVGERVSGGKTAFTYNWVWVRLSDANGDHSPRALLQLFNEAVSLEKRLNQTNVYERSIMRPRALIDSLDAVSEQAITALEEEFQELQPLFRNLEQVSRTPFPASSLDVDANIETLAREIGLLGVDLGTRDDVERYRVPELYRKALGMGRRGQA